VHSCRLQRASNVSLESRITPRVVTLSVVGKTKDVIETSWMTGNDCKHRNEPRRVASDFMGLGHMPLQQNHACKDDRQRSKHDVAVWRLDVDKPR